MKSAEADPNVTKPKTARVSLTRQLWLFLAISFVGSWSVWLVLIPLRDVAVTAETGSLRIAVPVSLLLGSLGACIPGIAALLLTGGHRLFNALLTIKAGFPKWLLVAVLTGFIIPLFAAYLHDASAPTSNWIRFFRVLSINLLLGPLWEEIGWRWFLLSRLEGPPLHRLIAVTLIWWLWHAPLLLLIRPFPTDLLTGFGLYGLAIVPFSVIVGISYLRSESLLVAVTMHALYNASVHFLGPYLSAGQMQPYLYMAAMFWLLGYACWFNFSTERASGPPFPQS
jgi:membrane protease YdiL (CAAX protease family)